MAASAPSPERVPTPSDAAEVEELVCDAAGSGRRLELRAGGTKAGLGRALTEEAARVDLSRLTGVVTYEPEELILVVRPGTRLLQVEELLAGCGQHLAFEPPHWGEAATVGGTLSCGWAGPRRFRAGSVRDFVLGVELVDGRGRRLRAGGRVVKNVTGYDLWRATVGAFGTLGILTEVCLKLWPRPTAERSLRVGGLALGEAAAGLLEWSRRPEEISGLAIDTEGRLLARLEGSERGVAQQVKQLVPEAPGPVEVLAADESARLWSGLREAEPYRAAPGEALWRIAVPPSRAPAAVSAMAAFGLRRSGLDWGGGLLWAVLPADADAAGVHEAVARLDGAGSRLATGPGDGNPRAFTPLSPGVARMNGILKSTLDPQGLFNRGRMYSGR